MAGRRRRGSLAIEFALVVPVFLAILAAIVDWGWYFHRSQLVIQATRAGARVGSVTPQDSDPEGEATSKVLTALENYGFDTSAATVTATLSGSSPDVEITVTTSVPFQPFIGLVPTPDALEASMTMRLEDN